MMHCKYLCASYWDHARCSCWPVFLCTKVFMANQQTGQHPLLPLINPSKSAWLRVTTTRKTDPINALRRRALQRTARLTNVPRTKHTIQNAMLDMGEYLKQRPTEVGALHNQATNFLNVNRNREAKLLLEKALRLHADHVPSLSTWQTYV